MIYDVIIIGGGPAAYTAGIYSVRAGLTTLILEGKDYGGQLMTTTEVENYPGFANGILGPDLMFHMRQQCDNLGCILKDELVKSVILSRTGLVHKVITEYIGYISKCVIIATGATAKRLNLPQEVIFWNHGISACAVCDGALPMFRNKPLAVIGGGDSACEEAMFLSRFGSTVYMFVRGDKMRASHNMKTKVQNNNKIQIIYNTVVTDAFGQNNDKVILEGIKTFNQKQNQVLEYKVSGLFYGIGHSPNTEFLNGILPVDEAGYIITENTKTSIPGVFACGDVQDKIYKQAITAAASGCMAALEAERYLTKEH